MRQNCNNMKISRRKAIKQGIAVALAMTIPPKIKPFKKAYEMNDKNDFDVIIVGGSYAGLSAAMALGRSLRKVLVLDSGLPCNRQTPHSHNFITHDGAVPAEIADDARSQVLKYDTVQFIQDLATKGTKRKENFEISTQSGKTYTAGKLIFATGIKDLMPDIKGFSDCWGISVVHCPYCHGYEIRHKKTAILANGEQAFHLAPMVKNLTNDVTILTSGKATFDETQLLKFKEHKIEVVEKEVVEIEHKNGQLSKVVFADNTTMPFDAVYGAIPFEQHSDIPQQLGCVLNDQGFIEVDMMNKTTIEGVFACGDNASRFRSVANAVASGNMAGAVANMELSHEQF